jgi:hypothetical protein
MLVLVQLDNYRFTQVYLFSVDNLFDLLWCTVTECRVTCDAHTLSQLVYWWIYHLPFHEPTSRVQTYSLRDSSDSWRLVHQTARQQPLAGPSTPSTSTSTGPAVCIPELDFKDVGETASIYSSQGRRNKRAVLRLALRDHPKLRNGLVQPHGCFTSATSNFSGHRGRLNTEQGDWFKFQVI